MSTCIECERETPNARCPTHRVEHNAATSHQSGPCPQCGQETVPRGVVCQDCLHSGDSP